MVTVPTMLGTSGTLILPRASPPRSSQTAMQLATITTPRNPCFRKSRLASSTAPRLTPTPIARGTLRPARLAVASEAPRAARRSRRWDGGVVIRLVSAPASDLEELAFLDLEDGVDVLDMLLGEDLELLLSAGTLVLTDIAVLDHMVDLFLGLAPNVADGHLGVLGLGSRKLDVLLAALLGQLRKVDPDDGAIAIGVNAQVGVTQGLLDLGHRRLVEWRDQDGAGLRSLEGRQLLQGGTRAVVLNRELVEHRGVGPSRADGREVLLGNLDGLLHLFLGLEHGFVDNQDSSSAVTSVPIFSPRMALAILPSPSIPKTIIGSLFSEHNANAAASTTRRPLNNASSYETRSSLTALESTRGSVL